MQDVRRFGATRRGEALSRKALKKPPFIAREAFLWLALFAPAVTLLVSRLGSGPEPVERVAGCLLSTWSCTIVCGLSVHAAVNAVAPTLLARTSRFVAIS